MDVIIFVLLGVLSVVQGQVPGLDGCPNPTVKADFEMEKYAGVWYEIERYWPIFYEFGVSCGRANYTMKDDGHVRVENLGYIKFLGAVNGIVGDAFAPNASEPAKLSVSFPDTYIPFGNGAYWILNTDYTNWAVVYSCSGLSGVAHADIIWIMGRSQKLSEDTITALHGMLDSMDLRTKPLVRASQENCPI